MRDASCGRAITKADLHPSSRSGLTIFKHGTARGGCRYYCGDGCGTRESRRKVWQFIGNTAKLTLGLFENLPRSTLYMGHTACVNLFCPYLAVEYDESWPFQSGRLT